MVSVLKSVFSKEAIFALVMGLVTNKLLGHNKRKAIENNNHTSATRMHSILVDPKEVFTNHELAVLTTVWEDDEPEGKFLKGRHGVTHYTVDRRLGDDDNGDKPSKGMVILCHGLGQSLKMYKEFSDILVNEGFSVLRYDYFGHGYSKPSGENMWVKYTTDVFVDQLEDLIDHVTAEEHEDIIAFVGHSNGGVVGIAANYRWSHKPSSKGRNVIPKLILANPAIYVSKPLLARVADRIPMVMKTLFTTIPSTLSLVGKNYMESILKTFGKDENGAYLYPDALKASMDKNERLFGLVKGVEEHPFLAASIFGVSSYCIPAGLLSQHREHLAALTKSTSTKDEILFVWGDKDITVPYKENFHEIEKMKDSSNIMKLVTLEDISHECFFENTPSFANAVLPTLNSDN